MKTKTITLYDYSELSPLAQKRALDEWNKENDDPFMQSHMISLLKEKLEERGIKYDNDIDVRYSLSNCQGDGFMFLGTFVFASELHKIEGQLKRYVVKIKHRGRYYHSYSKEVEISEYDDPEVGAGEDVYKEFEEIYQSICKEMETLGYDHIAWITSEENFIETCEANEYTFREDGTMENA